MTYRLPTLGNDELGSLASTFNIMGESLQKAAQELELKVEQRTSELKVTNENLLNEIAERKKAQEAMSESEQTLNRILIASPVGIAFVTSDRKLTYVNKSWLELFGYNDFEQLKGLRVDLFYASEEEFERVGSLISCFCAKGEPAVTDTTYLRKNGETFEAHLRVNPFDLSDMTKGFVSTIEDISEKKKAERELWDSEARFQAFMDNSPTVAFIKDEQGRYIYAKREWRLQFAPSVNDWKGKTANEFLPPQIANTFAGADRLAVERGETSQFIQLITGPGGDQRSWLTFKFPVQDASGKKYLGGVALDITDRLRAEEEREKLRNELFQLQKKEALGTLVGGIAHDFNNMLQIILGYSEILLMDKKKGDPGYKDLQTIIQTSKGGAELVKMLRAFGQQSQVIPAPLDLNHQIRQLSTLISRTLPEIVQVDLNLLDGPTTITADHNQIDQVIMNLAINASEAMSDGGELKIATTIVSLDDNYCKSHFGAKPGAYVMLSVTDNGRGMDEETLAKIFDPFFSTKERGSTRGTGLGLSVVQGIVQQNGGHVTCQSQPGKGTEFKVYFPAIEAPPAPAKTAASSVQSADTKTILIVEDNIPVAELERRDLETAGYKVIVANSGSDALEIFKARKQEISMVILDLLMREMSGRDCLIELLNIDPSVRVLVASGYAPEDELHREIRPLVKGFVRKPFAMSELVNEVSYAMANV
jgi:PAS domain S-box-containing protein